MSNQTMYRVTITQTNVFYIEAGCKADARTEAVEERIWDEDQQSPNSYEWFAHVEEVNK